ncbi:HLH [Musa troglodytarum]|uniref:HLH n=1 Tax=Musa troglodytarum TaxID=320322 RepID=A0A9E7I5D5_9LILI|nr:HLH [Musa troglodytarum]
MWALIEYFLHVNTSKMNHDSAAMTQMLTAPYFGMRSPEEGDEVIDLSLFLWRLKNNHCMCVCDSQGLAESNAELQSRGLCLVPVFAMVELLDQEAYGLNFY